MKKICLILGIVSILSSCGGGSGGSSTPDVSQGAELGPQLSVSAASPAPNGAFERIYWVDGNPAKTSYKSLKAAPGTRLPESSLKDGDKVTLRIFHFNDFHHHHVEVHPKKGETRKFAQMVKQVGDARRAAAPKEGVLFFSAGDDHIGTVLDELMGSDEQSFVMSPAYRAYSAAGLDVATLGNHEFDKGSRVLARMIGSDAKFPILSANVQDSTVLKAALVHPAIIGVSKGVRIGVIGITTPEETKTGFAEDPALKFAAVIATLKNVASALSRQVDLIVVLSHTGFNGTDAVGARHVIPEGDIEIAQYLSTLGRPAMVIGGHTHSVLNEQSLNAANVIMGVPIFQAGSWGSHLGEIQLDVSKAAGKVTVLTRSAMLHKLKERDIRVPASDPAYASYEQDTDVDLAFQQTVMAPMMDRLRVRLSEPLGTTGGTPEMGTPDTVADRYMGESAIANFMNDALVSSSASFPGGRVDFAAFNASGISAGVPLDAALTFNDWFAVMPYADVIRIVEMSGQQIKDMLQSNAKRLVRPGEQVKLAGFVSRGLLHFSGGIHYAVNLGGDATQAQAVNITLAGQPVDAVLDRKYRVVFSDYISNGNEGWKGAQILAGLPPAIVGFDIKSLGARDTGLIYRNEIVAYIKAKGVVSAETGARKDGRLIVTP
ncbi:MAG: bifunctional metallophosphatase/5'-nucleotidase [Glaciimonas sp.]|nr:bifunctional metallophosphatase/5'-nucleotidase [Glaciimonas sp.]